MRRPLLAVSALILGVIAFTATLSAATVQHFTLAELSANASVIAHVKVDSSSAAWNSAQTKIWTTHSLSVTETIKGQFAAVAQCSTRGGSVGRKEQAVAGEAQLVVGSEYLLFLWKDGDGRLRCVGMAQGALKITRTEGQAATAKNAYRGLTLVDAQGQQVAEKVGPISGTLTKLIADVKATLPKVEEAKPEGE